MPLIHDPDWQHELDVLSKRTSADIRSFRRNCLWKSFVILIAVILFTYGSQLPSSMVIAFTIAASALCILWFIGGVLMAIQCTMEIEIGTIEWIGRKQLGEYEPRTSYPRGGGCC